MADYIKNTLGLTFPKKITPRDAVINEVAMATFKPFFMKKARECIALGEKSFTMDTRNIILKFNFTTIDYVIDWLKSEAIECCKTSRTCCESGTEWDNETVIHRIPCIWVTFG